MLIGSLEVVSNREDWNETFVLTESADDAPDAPIDITGATFVLTVRDKNKGIVLSGSLDDGVTVSDGPSGTLEIDFDDSDMRRLCAGTYDVGLTMTLDGVTSQLIVGTLPIVDGVVP